MRSTLYAVKANHVDIMDLDADRLHDQLKKKTTQMEKQLDTQFGHLRIQMRRVQVKHERLKSLKEELRRLQKWLELGYDGASIGIAGGIGGVKQIEEAILDSYRGLKREDRETRRMDEASSNGNNLVSDMVSDLSRFNSDKGISELTGVTEQEVFHRKWEKIINSGMEREDLTFLNPMASKMLKRDDPGILAVNRLQRELGELNARLPKRVT